MYNPVSSGNFTDKFGWRTWPNGLSDYHTGQDISAPAWTPIYAAHSGVVLRKWWDQWASGAPGGGNMVSIRGDDGYETRYAHMIGQSSLAVGQRVVGGQTIVGYVGATGAATGNHLHFEVLRGGQFVDPLPLITSDTVNPEAPAGEKEDEEMAEKIKGVVHDSGIGSVQTVIIGQPSSGWKFKYTTKAMSGRNPENEKWANFFETGDFTSVNGDKSMIDAWERSLDNKRRGE